MNHNDEQISFARAAEILKCSRQNMTTWTKPKSAQDTQSLLTRGVKGSWTVSKNHCTAYRLMADFLQYDKPRVEMFTRDAALQYILRLHNALDVNQRHIAELQREVQPGSSVTADSPPQSGVKNVGEAAPKTGIDQSATSARTDVTQSEEMRAVEPSEQPSEMRPVAEVIKPQPESDQQHDAHVKHLQGMIARGYVPTPEENLLLPVLSRASLSIHDVARLTSCPLAFVEEIAAQGLLTRYQTGYDPMQVLSKRRTFAREVVVLRYRMQDDSDLDDEDYQDFDPDERILVGMRVWDLGAGDMTGTSRGFIYETEVRMLDWETLISYMASLTNASVPDIVSYAAQRFCKS
ncbi:MAG: hypothetical protein LCH41_06365 [Armatimonadetes bacterium]|nr:hypothetical protein [Armatimonadota bacterium]